MAGLIENGMGNATKFATIDPGVGEGTKSAQANTYSYDPSLRTVDPAKETTAGQLDAILAKGSPLMDRARSGAMQTANQRGLLNSSMAAQSGEAAVMDAALPIANADAGVYGTAAQSNVNAKNEALASGANAMNAAATQAASEANQLGAQTLKGSQATQLQELQGSQAMQQQAQKGEQAMQLQTLQGSQALEQQGLKGTQAETLAQIEANYKQLIQTSASASDLFKQTQAAIAAIESDTNTSAEQKQAAVSKVTQMLESSMNVIGAINNVDLTSLLDFS